ncbi:amidohydrolase [Pseudomonadales bacterium]|jgi:predicted TIM-barrel fold metal-dependent hydrolase|nr:amidohydrolase [Pseudomonadales bacterium]MDC3328090.1 amidohydrolase [Pseudomonadales bacterium]
MTYAAHRRIIDVDSHLFELDDFLHNAARPEHLDLVPSMHAQKGLAVPQAGLDRGRELLARRQSDPATMAKFEAALMDNTKSGWSRLGAFDPKERSHTLDLLGFEMQWVLPTYAFHQTLHAAHGDALAATAITLNRAMANFCAHDPRLKAVGYIPLNLGPERAKAIMDQGFEEGCYTFLVPTNEPNPENKSYTHPDFDPIWAGFAERGIPAGIHVAANGDYNPVSPSFKNNGKSELALGGDAPVGELALLNIGASAQLFLSAMIFDDVFTRHPDLRVMSMEHAAYWLPSWLHQLDFTANLLKRSRKFAEAPSVTAKRHIKVSPFAGEPVGWIIDNVGPDMLVFASDYPHPEGTNDPIGKFERTMTDCDAETMDKFYFGNMLDLMGLS